MKDKEFYTKANRSAIIVNTLITEIPEGSFGRPQAEDLDHPSDIEIRKAVSNGLSIWRLRVSYREGFNEEQDFSEFYASKEQAMKAQASYGIGSTVEPLDFFSPISREFDPNSLSIWTELSVYGRGEPPYDLINEVLVGAGVRESWIKLSEQVLQWLGPSGESALKTRFGENWTAVASLEFCVKHFHQTSLATIAARVEVADFVSQFDYDTGYAARELELLYGGAEELALQSMETRKLAGKAGAEASRKRRLTNLETLIQEIENLVDAVGLISEDRIVAQAFETARERQPAMPKTNRTLEEYGTALRSEEPFKSRYEAVFRKNA